MLNKMKHLAIAGAVLLTPVIAAGAASAATVGYTVQNNDTMYKIAQHYGISLSSLERANPQIADYNMIWGGMKINLPTTTAAPAASAPAASAPASSGISAYAQQVAEIVNQERAKQGLSPLQLNTDLSVMALDKAKDMFNNNYFDHTSPYYGSPFDMMNKYGISYSYAGENIAKGQSNPQEVMTAWMNSQGHRENILNAHYSSIGVAYYNGEWVQEFIG